MLTMLNLQGWALFLSAASCEGEKQVKTWQPSMKKCKRSSFTVCFTWDLVTHSLFKQHFLKNRKHEVWSKTTKRINKRQILCVIGASESHVQVLLASDKSIQKLLEAPAASAASAAAAHRPDWGLIAPEIICQYYPGQVLWCTTCCIAILDKAENYCIIFHRPLLTIHTGSCHFLIRNQESSILLFNQSWSEPVSALECIKPKARGPNVAH